MSSFDWRIRNGNFSLVPGKPLLMGIVNITPDSFYAGSRRPGPEVAVEHALRLLKEGADILDLGGESSRPDSEPIEAAEEARRVIPVLEAILSAAPEAIVSIDTIRAGLARVALRRGAHIINDISAGRFDPAMPRVIAETGAGVILMHMQGTPRDMQVEPHYEDVRHEVTTFLMDRVKVYEEAGCDRRALAVDPGIGFGKRPEHNLALLWMMNVLGESGFPIVVGASRKRFISAVTHAPEPEDRLPGSLAAALWCLQAGVQILRVHDVAATRQALEVWSAIHDAQPAPKDQL